jgi:hypothetical protein
MRGPAVKQSLRPTLGDLLAPHWQAAGPRTRVVVRVLIGAAVAGAVALAVRYPRDPWVVHRDPTVSFQLQYPRGFDRVRTPTGAYARVEQRTGGRLVQAIEFDPVRLPPYSGDVSGELPLFANSYIARLAARTPAFRLESEGKTRIDRFPGYYVSFTTVLAGRIMFGKDIIFMPRLTRVRDGVIVAIRSAPGAPVLVPDQIGLVGPLQTPVHSFRFGG